MDQGQFIRHRARPDWGIGQILRKADDRIDVQFRHGLVTLRLSIAQNHLETVSKSEALADNPSLKPMRKGPASTASAARRQPKKKVPEPEEEEEAEAVVGDDDE